LDSDYEATEDDQPNLDDASAQRAAHFSAYDGADVVPDESELQGITAFRDERARQMRGGFHWYASGRTYVRPTEAKAPKAKVFKRSDVVATGAVGKKSFSGDTDKVRKRPANKK
jgi:hypothetical protein